jgi:hypothetical protein
MQYDFNREINRRGTHSIKWGFMQDEEDPLRAKPTEAFFGENRILPCGWPTWTSPLPGPSWRR